MIMETKYDVGHTFWAPRCHTQYDKETLVFEDNEWEREVKRYCAYAKQKIVKKIVASTTCFGKVNGLHVQYYVVNVGEKDAMSQVYSEDQITNRTEEEAYAFAMEYQKQEREYYGN
jgi:hypothetical protein